MSAWDEEMIDRSIDETLSSLQDKRMVLPAALFLAGHRPMAFTVGQLLLLLQPLAAFIGGDRIGAWGRLLSHPAGPAALGDRLNELLEEDELSERQGTSES